MTTFKHGAEIDLEAERAEEERVLREEMAWQAWCERAHPTAEFLPIVYPAETFDTYDGVDEAYRRMEEDGDSNEQNCDHYA